MRNRELEKEEENKRKSLDLEFDEDLEKLRAHFGPDIEELRGTVNWLGLDRHEWIEKKLIEWRDSRPKKPKGKFRDYSHTAAKFQQAFFLSIRTQCPNVIEELRGLAAYFRPLFANGSADDCHNLFWQVRQNLFEPGYVVRNMHHGYLAPKYDDEFFLGEYQPLFSALITDTMRSGIVDHAHSERAQTVFTASNSIREVLGPFTEDGIDAAMHFSQLQFHLNEWAIKYKIGKDWVIAYGHYFIHQFSERPDLPLEELTIETRDNLSLEAEEFEIALRGWRSGIETAPAYKKAVLESVKDRLEKYFDQTSRSLYLDNANQITKPYQFDRVTWLVWWTVLGWNKEQILDKLGETEKRFIGRSAVDEAFAKFKDWGLPVRT